MNGLMSMGDYNVQFWKYVLVIFAFDSDLYI